MAKIKGWKKTLELPYRIDYNNTTGRYNKALGLGQKAIIIAKEVNNDYGKDVNPWGYVNTWKVVKRVYAGSVDGQKYTTLKGGMTKKEALEYAMNYMRSHPDG